MGLCRTNVNLDSDLWKWAQKHGKKDDRSGSYIVNKAIEAYRNKVDKPKKAPNVPAVAIEAICWMPLNTGEHPITQADLDKYAQLYPAVDIMAEVRSMIGWLDANPTKRKTSAGVGRFINSWLKRCQDKGGSSQVQTNGNHSAKTQRNIDNLGDW